MSFVLLLVFTTFIFSFSELKINNKDYFFVSLVKSLIEYFFF